MMKTVLVVLVVYHLAHCAETNLPNFVIFYADDAGYGDFGFMGHPTINTPALDKLAAKSLRYTQHYTGAPICSPSRGSLLTGRLPVRNGVYTSFQWPEDNGFRVFYPTSTGSLMHTENTLQQELKGAGYMNGIIGKWHLGHHNKSLPTERGFDYWFGLPYSQDEGCPPGYGIPCSNTGKLFTPTPLYENTDIVQQPVNLNTYVPRMNQKAFDFIDNATAADQPFFLYMAYDEVHVELFASADFQNCSLRGAFGDAMSELDNSVGQILEYLESKGLTDNTYIYFSSDNGPWTSLGLDGGTAGLFRGQKGETWEGGMREPGLISGPGVIAGTNQDITSQMDIFVTFLELANVTIPTDHILDGVSLTDSMFGKGSVDRECFYLYRDSNLMAARCGAYKAHYITRCGFCLEPPVYHDPPLLFDVNQDPSEALPINSTDPRYQPAIDYINQQVAAMEADLVPGSPELDGQSPLVEPCCSELTRPRCTCGPW